MEIQSKRSLTITMRQKQKLETPDSFWQEYERKHPKSAEFLKIQRIIQFSETNLKLLADIEKATQENSLVKDVLKSYLT